MATQGSKTRTCNVPDCNKPGKSGRGLCSMHYFRLVGKNQAAREEAERYANPLKGKGSKTKAGKPAKRRSARPAMSTRGDEAPAAAPAEPKSPAHLSGAQPGEAVTDVFKAREDGRFAGICELCTVLRLKKTQHLGGMLIDVAGLTDDDGQDRPAMLYLSPEGELRTAAFTLGDVIRPGN